MLVLLMCLGNGALKSSERVALLRRDDSMSCACGPALDVRVVELLATFGAIMTCGLYVVRGGAIALGMVGTTGACRDLGRLGLVRLNSSIWVGGCDLGLVSLWLDATRLASGSIMPVLIAA